MSGRKGGRKSAPTLLVIGGMCVWGVLILLSPLLEAETHTEGGARDGDSEGRAGQQKLGRTTFSTTPDILRPSQREGWET